MIRLVLLTLSTWISVMAWYQTTFDIGQISDFRVAVQGDRITVAPGRLLWAPRVEDDTQQEPYRVIEFEQAQIRVTGGAGRIGVYLEWSSGEPRLGCFSVSEQQPLRYEMVAGFDGPCAVAPSNLGWDWAWPAKMKPLARVYIADGALSVQDMRTIATAP